MEKIKYLLSAALFSLILTTYGAEPNPRKRKLSETEIVGLDEEQKESTELENEKKQKSELGKFTLISSEGEKFEVPLNIALQSNLIKNALEFQNVDELPILIKSKDLKILIATMNLIAQYPHLENKKELYEIIQNKLLNLYEGNEAYLNEYFSYFKTSEIFELFKQSVKLEFELLENFFADKLVQKLFNSDKSLNIYNLQELISLFSFNADFFRGSWYLIEKFYYLRSSINKPDLNNLLINIYPDLRKTFNINLLNLEVKSREIITKWKLSINDLIDYKKNPTHSFSRFYLNNINGLHRIPNVDDIETLDLSFNEITELGNNLNVLKKIHYLNLAYNEISDLGHSFDEVESLEELDLDNNKITQLGDSLKELINLTTLYITNNQITTIGDSLQELTNLDELDFSNNKITSLGDSLHNLIKLEICRFSHNQIKTLGNSFNGLIDLNHLDLSNNQIEIIENSFNDLSNLQELDLSYNQITNLGKSFKELNNLMVLRLKNNQIIDLNNSFNGLDSLEYLDLSYNQITNIDNNLNTLPRLVKLNISNNQIVDLTNIRELILRLILINAQNNPLNEESRQLLEEFQNQELEDEDFEDNEENEEQFEDDENDEEENEDEIEPMEIV